MRKKWAFIVSAMLLAAVLSACGRANTDKTAEQTAAAETGNLQTEESMKQTTGATEQETVKESIKETTKETAPETTLQETTAADKKQDDLSEYTVSFDKTYADGSETAVVTAYSGSGETVWTFTKEYPVAQLSNIENIGVRDGRYYYVDQGTVRALDLADGSQVWENDGFGGSIAEHAFAFGDDGRLYLAGYFGPDLCVLNKDGRIEKLIDTLTADYFWPYRILYLDDKLEISFEGSSSGEQGKVYVDLDSYAVETDGQVPVTAETPESGSVPVVSYVTASSHLSEPQYGVDHTAESVVDSDLNTAWCENAAGQGIGESVTLYFAENCTVNGVTVYAGFQESEDLYYKNSRPSSLTVVFSDGSSRKLYLDDMIAGQTIQFDTPVTTGSLTFVIDAVYAGYKYEDTLISEIAVF